MKMDKEHLHKVQNEYFEYKGQRYYAGTKFTMKKRNSYDQWRTVEATFRGYSVLNNKKFSICYKDMNVKSRLGADYCFDVTYDELQDIIIDITSGNYYVELAEKKRYVSDSNIPELVVGWPLYIFLMIGSSIFNDRVSGWILITIIFFIWRHKLKEEEYYYYE